ncbi:hypothetical protein FOA43_001660 [Brettanomyces nanus]|uniref:Uncharacterized protein n=1 Tax=Eeniella nana TaxID=13502 RepID=A0A875S0A0_EENNA|nr:uncharacterized protein FOA43_001660 [Brettanomyces nanus]QPG74333.1 hypothetical protein FOA43_001660 [Brettanomyces nanus]
MPDFADKTFDAANTVYQSTYSTFVFLFDHVKENTQTVMDFTVDNAHKLQDRSKEMWNNTVSDSPQYSSESSLRSKLISKVSNNINTIGLYGGAPLSLFIGYELYRAIYPYRRRAQKLPTGRRFEVILVVGHPESNFVKKLIHDLNARGYIVFVVVSDERQLRIVEEEKDDDIKPLIVDYESSSTVKASLLKLAKYLDTPIDNTYYHLRGCIFIPDYFRMPKISRMDQLSGREFKRVMDEQIFSLNMLLSNGLNVFLRESNNRRKSVQECNNVKIGGGYSKLIFVNFVMYAKNETRTLLLRLACSLNQTFFDELHRELAPGLIESFSRSIFGIDRDSSKIDISMISIKYEKDTESHLIGDSLIDNFKGSTKNKRLSSKDVHYKIYDLLNSNWLKRDYHIHN